MPDIVTALRSQPVPRSNATGTISIQDEIEHKMEFCWFALARSVSAYHIDVNCAGVNVVRRLWLLYYADCGWVIHITPREERSNLFQYIRLQV